MRKYTLKSKKLINRRKKRVKLIYQTFLTVPNNDVYIKYSLSSTGLLVVGGYDASSE